MAHPHHTVLVLRHAKAEQAGRTDFERVLADRGHADAAAAGAWLAAAGLVPDHAIVSAATRTHQTWDDVARAAGWDLEPELDEGLYAADTDTALDLLRAVDEAHRVVVVVGHNPTMASLAQLLDDGEGDVDGGNEMAMGFPTSAMALLTVDGPWAGLGRGGARLTAFHVARG